MRTPPNILPRDWLGVPLGPSALIAERLPSPPADALGRLIQWTTYGDLSSCGIPRAPQGFMTRFRHAAVNPAVDDGFATALKNGRARVVGEVKRLDRDGATLLDGGRVPVNVVICATGYRRGLERLVGHLDVLDDGGAPRYPAGAPGNPDTPGLYFAGFQVALSGSIRVAGIHARRIANTIATDKRTLPIIRRGATGYATELKPSPALRGGCTSAIAPDTVDVAAASPASRSAQSGECRVPGPLSATEAVQPGGSGFVEAGAAGPLHGFAPFVLLANLRAGALSSGRPASPSAR
jgi:hypothetical protein